MRRLVSPLRVSLLAVSVMAMASCDSGGSAPVETKKAPAEEELDAETKARIAERKAAREAEAKAKAEAEAKLESEIERLCIVPENVEKDFVKACDGVGQAMDGFVRRSGDAEAIAAWDAGDNEKGIAMTVVQCTQADSVEVAACQKNVFDNLGPEMRDYIKDFMQACIDKHASKKAPKGAVPPKRRPG